MLKFVYINNYIRELKCAGLAPCWGRPQTVFVQMVLHVRPLKTALPHAALHK